MNRGNNNDEYSNREIDTMFGELQSDVKEILAQVRRTNGRVSSLENWRWFITGGVAVISIIIVPIIVKLISG